MRIYLTAERIHNPRQGWSGWLAKFQSVDWSGYVGSPHTSAAAAIKAGHLALSEMHPNASIIVTQRKAEVRS